jgi:hypothetical protein
MFHQGHGNDFPSGADFKTSDTQMSNFW